MHTKTQFTYSSQWPVFNLRMPPEQKLVLQAEAVKNHRSLNSEIIARLYKSLEPQYKR